MLCSIQDLRFTYIYFTYCTYENEVEILYGKWVIYSQQFAKYAPLLQVAHDEKQYSSFAEKIIINLTKYVSKQASK